MSLSCVPGAMDARRDGQGEGQEGPFWGSSFAVGWTDQGQEWGYSRMVADMEDDGRTVQAGRRVRSTASGEE